MDQLLNTKERRWKLVVRRSVFLTGGEIGISRTGVYTNVHLYTHTGTNNSVYLVGMLHSGETAYYENVQNVLDKCDTVIYENILPFEHSKEDTSFVSTPDIDDCADLFLLSVQSYFAILEDSNIRFLAKEGHVFAETYNRKNWVCGDLLGTDEFSSENAWDNIDELLEKIPEKDLLQRAVCLAGIIKRIKNRSFNRKDFAKAMLAAFGNEDIAAIFIKGLAQKRDLYCFDVFDTVVSGQENQTIGIKYGAAHIPFQRKLLEERGYELISTSKNFCVRF